MAGEFSEVAGDGGIDGAMPFHGVEGGENFTDENELEV
jgi:hypothetical protein